MSDMEQAVKRLVEEVCECIEMGYNRRDMLYDIREAQSAVLALYADALRERDEARAEVRKAHDELVFAKNDTEREKRRADAALLVVTEKELQLDIANHAAAQALNERDEARLLAVQTGKALHHLRNEIHAWISIAQDEWIEGVGVTNMRCMESRVAEADAALAALKAAKLEV